MKQCWIKYIHKKIEKYPCLIVQGRHYGKEVGARSKWAADQPVESGFQCTGCPANFTANGTLGVKHIFGQCFGSVSTDPSFCFADSGSSPDPGILLNTGPIRDLDQDFLFLWKNFSCQYPAFWDGKVWLRPALFWVPDPHWGKKLDPDTKHCLGPKFNVLKLNPKK